MLFVYGWFLFDFVEVIANLMIYYLAVNFFISKLHIFLFIKILYLRKPAKTKNKNLEEKITIDFFASF